MGVVTSGLAYWLHIRILVHVSPVAAMSPTFLIPVFGVTWGHLFLGEQLSSGIYLGGALVLLAVIILAVISRNAAAGRAQAERRRKFRTLTDYGRNEMELDGEPSTAHVSYVNPMVAAAGGAVAATAVSHAHDDHGHDDHGHDAHAHDDHGHDTHAHDDHAHDDHGHAGDAHAAHPDPHAPAEHVAHVSPAAAATANENGRAARK